MNRPIRRVLATGLLLAAVAYVAACSSEAPATSKVLVVVNVDAAIADAITQVKAQVFSVGGGPAIDEQSYTLTTGTPRAGELTAPFSFGIAKKKAARFLLVVSGYERSGRAPVIEQKVFASFREGKVLLLPIYLSSVCYNAPCESLSQTCRDGSGEAECAEVQEVENLEPVHAGDEIAAGSVISSTTRDVPGADESPDAAAMAPESDASSASPLDAGVRAQSEAGTTPESSMGADSGCADNACGGRTRCAAGQYLKAATDDSANKTCTGCESGTFSAREDAPTCTVWKTCDPGTYVANTPSASVDRMCEPCGQGIITQTANQSTCLPPGSCQAGSVQTAAGTSTSATMCRNCQAGEYCAGGTTPSAACTGDTWDHDANPATVCTMRTVCAAGQYITAAGTATTNRACQPCLAGSFSAQTNAAACTPWTTCLEGSQESRPGSNTTNRACIAGWTRQFGTSDNDYVFEVGVDGAGYIYAAGSTREALPGQISGGNWDAYLRKYDSSGTELWTRQFGTTSAEGCSALGIDQAGNVYLAGPTNEAFPGFGEGDGVGDSYLRKYSGSGALLWSRQFGTSSSLAVVSMAVDSSGSVYIGGYTTGALADFVNAGGYDAFVSKYDGAGTLIWTQQFGTGDQDYLKGVAVDGNGNLFATGITRGAFPGSLNANNFETFVRKYNPAGVAQWTRQFGGTAGASGKAIGCDSTGSVYVAGNVSDALPGQMKTTAFEGFMRKYDGAGNETWTRQFTSSEPTEVEAMVVSGPDRVFVAGDTAGVFPGQYQGSGRDLFVRSYDSAGNLLATKQFGSTGDVTPHALAVDGSGNIYIGGDTTSAFPGSKNLGSYDAFLTKLAP